MNYKPRLGGIIYGAASVILCTGITIGGLRWALNEAHGPELPVYAVTVPVLAISDAEELAIAAGYDPAAPYGECTLDRIDCDQGYSPDNCRWVDMKVQANNRRPAKKKRAAPSGANAGDSKEK